MIFNISTTTTDPCDVFYILRKIVQEQYIQPTYSSRQEIQQSMQILLARYLQVLPEPSAREKIKLYWEDYLKEHFVDFNVQNAIENKKADPETKDQTPLVDLIKQFTDTVQTLVEADEWESDNYDDNDEIDDKINEKLTLAKRIIQQLPTQEISDHESFNQSYHQFIEYLDEH